MSQLPPPGWYADPHGFSAYRWWDGLTWTAHTNGGLATADTAAAIAPAAAQQGFFAGTVTPRQHQYPPAQPTPYGPNSSGGSRSQTSGWHRNEYAFITFGTFAIYAYLALAAHHYFLGIGPAAASMRSLARKEPLAIWAVMVAVVAVVIGAVAYSHR